MKKTFTFWKSLFLLCALLFGTSAWGADVTYTVTSKTAVTTSGTAPEGSSVTFSSNGNTAQQLTKNTGQTLTLKNYNGQKITQLVLSMRSNGSDGSGKLSYSTDGGTTYTYLVGSADAGVAFSNSAWNGSYTTTYTDVTKSSLNIICGSSDVIFKIESTKNSIYCQSYTITYAPTDNRPAIASNISMSPSIFDFNTNGTFGLTITPADGIVPADYTISCESDDETVMTAVGEAYETYEKKGFANITVTVSPVSAKEESYKSYSKKIKVKVYDFSANDGSASKPFTVAEAKAFKETPDVFYDAEESYYVKGWIDRLGTYNSTTKKYSYYISDDATTTGELWVYTGKNLDNGDFDASSDLEVEDYVVVYGQIGTRNSSTAMLDGNYITTLSRRPGAGFSFPDETINTYPNTNPFTGATLNNPNNVTVTYSSNNAAAAVDAETGDVTIGNPENDVTATITATYTGTTTTPYKTTTATYKIKVARDANGLKFPTNPDVTTHANNATVTEPILTNPNNLAVTWSTSDADVATVDNAGQVITHSKEGTAIITATYTQTDHYKGGAVSYNVTVERGDLDHVFTPSSVILKKGESFTSPTFSGTENVTGWEFTSTYNNVASVDANGVISLGGSTGVAIIKATFAQNDFYHAHSTSCTITVNPATDVEEPAVPGNYQKITSTSQMTDGKYLIVYETANVAFNGNRPTIDANFNTIDVTISDGVIAKSNDVDNAAFIYDSSNGSFKSAKGLYLKGGSSKLYESETPETHTIEFDSNGNISMTNNGGTLKFNDNTSANRFRYYSSGQKNVQIYKFVAGEPVNTINIQVSEAGFATYVSNFDLDYSSNANLKAYIAKEVSGEIKFTEVEKVPANTGVLLRATDGGGNTYTVNTTTAETDDMTGNKLVRGTGAAVATGTNPYNYILNVVNNELGFYRANNQTVATNRAYLQTSVTPGALAKIAIIFDDATTSINALDNLTDSQLDSDAPIYNLAGQKVTKAYKGVVIQNGKKLVRK